MTEERVFYWQGMIEARMAIEERERKENMDDVEKIKDIPIVRILDARWNKTTWWAFAPPLSTDLFEFRTDQTDLHSLSTSSSLFLLLLLLRLLLLGDQMMMIRRIMIFDIASIWLMRENFFWINLDWRRGILFRSFSKRITAEQIEIIWLFE